MSYIWSMIAAAGVCCALLYLLRPAALRFGLVDEPDERKTHAGTVPLVGGVAIFAGFTLAALTLDAELTAYRSFFSAAGLLVIVGVLDDLHELSSQARFGTQIGAALIMAYWGGVVLHDLGSLGAGENVFVLRGWNIVFTVFATVGVINALNMSDGLDGLAGGLSLIALVSLAYVADGAGRAVECGLLLVLAAAVAGFLVLNLRLPWRPRALVFMGDAGSMFLGFAISWFFIAMSQGEQRAMPPVLALWLFMVPLFDTVWLILWRFSQGRSPTSSDVGHLHHVLQMAGFRPAASAWIILAIAALGALAGIVGVATGIPENTMFRLFLALFAVYCVFMAVSWHRRRLLWWPLERRLLGLRDRREHAIATGVERRRMPERRGQV